MPRISKVFELNVTVEQFLNACSAVELQELEVLLYSPRFQAKIARESQNEERKEIKVSGISFLQSAQDDEFTPA